MPGISPLTLPWATLKLVARFAVPLALWCTAGEFLRYAIMYGGYRLGLHNSAVPIAALSLMVLASLCTAVAMVHSLRDGLPAIKAHEEHGTLAPWATDDEEGIADVFGRAVLPFMVFYLAWGWYSRDAHDFVSAAEARGFAEGGITGQLAGQKLLINLLGGSRNLWIAIGLSVVFFVAKVIVERFIQERAPRAGGLLAAYCEVNWTLYGIFTVDVLRKDVGAWVTGRVAWHWLHVPLGPIGTFWPLFKVAILGSLVWLVIAGVILGVDSDEEKAMGDGRIGRGLAVVSGLHHEHSPYEVLTRGFRDKWLPTWYGMRLVRRAGLVLFGTFCVLYTGLDVGESAARRSVYVLIGPHPIAWWVPMLHVVGFAVALVFQLLRICLLAAAFNLVVGRVTAGKAAGASGRHAAGPLSAISVVSARNAAPEPHPGQVSRTAVPAPSP